MSLEELKEEGALPLKWKKPSPPGPGATVGERVEYSIAEAIRRFFSLFDEPLAELLSIPLRLLIKVVEKSTAGYMRPILNQAVRAMPEGDPWREILEQLRDPTGEGGMALLAGMGSQAGAAGLMSVFEPAFETWRQNAYLGNPSKLPDPLSILALRARGSISEAQLEEWWQRQGMAKGFAMPLWDIARLRPSEGDLGVMSLREIMGAEDYKAELQARGMSEAEADQAEQLLHMIPGPGDLIRMAVREAFSEDLISQFQLDADLPSDFVEWAQKVGLDPEWSRREWIAHWALPSLTMGYEMLHREVIGDEELDLLLRMQDVAPYWRDKLKAVSYRPYTRVDTRRMYDFGVLDESGVLKSYTDQGYAPDKAANMTEFTIRYAQEEQRDATKTDILTALAEGALTPADSLSFLIEIGYSDLFAEVYVARTVAKVVAAAQREEEKKVRDETVKEREETKGDVVGAYRDGVYNRTEASQALVVIGYPESVADVALTRVDFQKQRDLVRAELSTVKTLYVSRRIELPEVHERLGKVNLPAAQIDAVVEVWDIARQKRTERPSPAKLLSWFKRDVIPEERLREELAGHGYAEDYIDLYIADLLLEALEEEKAEAERLAKEQEREEASTFRDDRRVTLNQLDIEVQEIRVYIAELKVLALEITETQTLTEIGKTIVQLKAEMARLRLEKLRHPVVIPEE